MFKGLDEGYKPGFLGKWLLHEIMPTGCPLGFRWNVTDGNSHPGSIREPLKNPPGSQTGYDKGARYLPERDPWFLGGWLGFLSSTECLIYTGPLYKTYSLICFLWDPYVFRTLCCNSFGQATSNVCELMEAWATNAWHFTRVCEICSGYDYVGIVIIVTICDSKRILIFLF